MFTFKPSASVRAKQRKAGRRLLTVACVLAALPVAAAQASPGSLDPSFNGTGKITTAIGLSDAYANALVRQPDGKLVTAGYAYGGGATALDFALTRYNPDGSLDTSFNGTGKVTTAVGPGFALDYANALALQPDGKLVAAGSSNNGSKNDFAVARYNPDGSPDTSFHGTGKVTTAIGPADNEAYAVAVQPDGKVLVAGKSSNGSNYDFALARYNPDGSPDTSFNGTGKVTTAIGPDDDIAAAIAVQPDGKLVLAGHSYTGSQDVFALVRYNPDGSLDTSFHGSGKVTTAIGTAQDDASSLALQPDGRLLAAGASYTGSSYDFALVRYNPDGSLDTSFNGTGKVTTAIGPDNDVAEALALQPDGKPVAAGYSWNGSDELVALARYDPDGSLDPAFGSGGKVTTAIGSSRDEARALALQPDGKLVAAGYSWDGSKSVPALVRYLGNSLTVAKSGSGSGSVTSSPNGIDCGSTCSTPFAAGPLTLTATAAAGSTFVGWSGDCSGAGPCTLALSGDRAVTARFETDKTLALTKAGSGTGTVTSSPAAISCGVTCSHLFTYGTVVTLTASASPTSRFVGWSGACSGIGACTLTLTANQDAIANFKPLCVVPKVKGKTLATAKKAIKRAQCKVGKVTKVFSAKVKKGRVIAQKRKPGNKLAAGTKITLKVSKGNKAVRP
ncbi:MAG TPA: PASTA domain-containing protein [Solirubrobacteraceae bacterium]|nr:PASTA domain-containing protein [Solirubrobacteraceae bacterium]